MLGMVEARIFESVESRITLIRVMAKDKKEASPRNKKYSTILLTE
jgi:hypothetical protein